eukprot:241305_1
MVAKFHGPTSTSLSIIIAAQFAGTNGLILKMGKYIRNTFYFDCSMSGFDREQEHLFIGGYASLKIQTILDLSGDDFENYDRYLSLMECFFCICRNAHVDESVTSSLDPNDNILQSIIENQTDQKNDNTSDVPIYILNLFQFRCNRLKQINIYLDEFIKISNVLNICKCSLNGDRSMINFNFLIHLFPNTEKIRITVTNKFNFTKQFAEYLSQNLVKNCIQSSTCFQCIEFCFGMKLLSKKIEDQIEQLSLTGIVDKHGRIPMDAHDHEWLYKIGWTIRIGSNEEDTTSVYFVKRHQKNDVFNNHNIPWKSYKKKVFDNRTLSSNSHLKDESIMKCIGTLEFQFRMDNYQRCTKCTTGTVFAVQHETNKAFIISNADGCHFNNFFATKICFIRRSIQKERVGEIEYEYDVEIEYIPDGLDLAVFSIEDKDGYYLHRTKNIKLAEGLSTLTQYNKFNIYGYSFGHKCFELSGTSTVGNDFGIEESGQQFVLKQNEIFTASGQEGSSVWVKNENTEKTLIFAVQIDFAGIATLLRNEDLTVIRSLLELSLRCICGLRLLPRMSEHCYENDSVSVRCGRCTNVIFSGEIVYHCGTNPPMHKDRYDLCVTCARYLKQHPPLSLKCICGIVLLPIQSKNCYENDSVSLSCVRCLDIFSDQIIYHCWKGTNVPHEDGYDLCGKCATQVKQNETLDRMGDLFEDIVVKIASFTVTENLRSMMRLKLINKHWYESLNPCKSEVNEIWECNICRTLFPYVPKNLKIKRWDRYYLYKYYSLMQQRKDYQRLSKVSIDTGSAYRTFEMVENCAYVTDQLNEIKDNENEFHIGTHGLPPECKLKPKCPVSALKMKIVGVGKYSCNVCQKHVHFAKSEQKMLDIVSKGQCVQYSMDDQPKVVNTMFKKATLRDVRHPIDESYFKNEPIIDCIGLLQFHYDYKDNAKPDQYGTGTIFGCSKEKAFIISNAGNCRLSTLAPTSVYFICEQSGKTKKYEVKIEYFNNKYLSMNQPNAGFDYAVFSFEEKNQFYVQSTKDITLINGMKALEQYRRFTIYGYKVSFNSHQLISELCGDSSFGNNYRILKHKVSGKHYLQQKEVFASTGGPTLWAKDEMTGSINIFGIHTGKSAKHGYKVAHLLSDEDLQDIFNCIQSTIDAV